MEIIWYGHACFRITERGQASVVCDPYDHGVVGYEPLKLKAEIVTISNNSPGHNNLKAVKGKPYVVKSPGEYEIGGVFITGIRTDARREGENNKFINSMYLIEYGEINVVHLGDMHIVPTQTEVESLGPVNIALVPVGGSGSLNAAKASEVISLLEPNIVIPMHYATPSTTIELETISKFIKEMGLSEVETLPSLKIGKVNELPEETKVVILDYARK
ncbi:MAG TPA: MBL fold metallo-hydrolase [Anaerolineae bacterium]|nr:MBL fold metallo-hydrolase [Anaerolineae bacterium]